MKYTPFTITSTVLLVAVLLLMPVFQIFAKTSVSSSAPVSSKQTTVTSVVQSSPTSPVRRTPTLPVHITDSSDTRTPSRHTVTQDRIRPVSPAVQSSLVPGQVLVFAGSTSSGGASQYLNDVWVGTGNMATWSQISPQQQNTNDIWSPRRTAAAAYFQGRIWIVGGFGPVMHNNDVWSSADGVDWQLEYSGPSNAWISGDHATLTVFQNKLWLISYLGVWNSANGQDWNQVVPGSHPCIAQRSGHTALVFGGKLWLMGTWNPNSSNDVCSSSDGINWTTAVAHAPWGKRNFHTSVVFGGSMWVLFGRSTVNPGAGGWQFEPQYDVWKSSDGIVWSQVVSTTTIGNVQGATMVVSSGNMYLLGGSDDESMSMDTIWKTSDGVNWSQVDTNTIWPARGYHNTIVIPSSGGIGVTTGVSIDVPITVDESGPDLVITYADAYPDTVHWNQYGNELTVTCVIRNDGGSAVTVPAGTRIGVYNGQVSAGSKLGGIVLTSSIVLPPQGEHGYGFTVYAPTSQFPVTGNYTLSIAIDTWPGFGGYVNYVTEANEDNNTETMDLTIIP